MNEYIVGEYNLYNIIFIKNRSNYKIFYRGNKVDSMKSKYSSQKYDNLVLSTPHMNMPFGREIYYHKDIMNIEFTNYKKNNTMYNMFTTIQHIDNFFRRLAYDKYLIKKMRYSNTINLSGKTYDSCIKYRPHKFAPLLRTHIKKNTIFIDDVNKQLVEYDNLKSKCGKFSLHIGTLWVSKYKYGIIVYITDGTINTIVEK
uniref:Uncharacterized protein n=1 Tax=Mimivirus LCMiAC02 TaxID=2506609 RepID=A0A4D5XF29_9VIRU|nr:MAG: hypothetical protein LCMiAC02_04500 [Mimivirus LCMiAC02]